MNASHASYLINIAHPNKTSRVKAVKSLINELDCAEKLGLLGVILHPGSNPGKDKCLMAAESINQAFLKNSNTILAIETTAGQGSAIGCRFEELKEIIDNVNDKKRLKVCFDTCHVFSSGYDLRDEEAYNKTMNEFDRIISFKKLLAFHLNDSMKELGSRIDRHEQIGEGKIGLAGFKLLVNDRRFKDIPGYLETPELANGEESYAYNIKKLRGLVL